MGDMLLKHKRPQHQWQSTEMLAGRKVWPPIYPQRVSSPRYHLHHHPTEYAYAYARYGNSSHPGALRESQYYYRNMMPPPPNHHRPFMDRNLIKPKVQHSLCSPCRCKSKSLEDVRADIVDYNEDFNGNKLVFRDKFGERQRAKQNSGRSMDNLMMDVSYPSSRWMRSCQVCLECSTSILF